MKSLKTRILSAAMAGILAVSMAIPALASSTSITGNFEDIEIAVLVPQTGKAQVNPYGLPVALKTTGKSITGEQIVTHPLAIANKSDVNLAVSARATATASGDLKFVEAAPLADDTSKSAFVYLQFKKDNSLVENALNTEKTAFTDTVLDTAASTWKQAYNADKDLVLNGRETGSSKNNMVFLKKAGPSSAIQTGGAALFRLSGSVVADPREAWTESDGFTATIAFTFKPDTTAVKADKTSVEVTAATGAGQTAVVTLTGFTGEGVGFSTEASDITWSCSPTAKATVAQDNTDPKKATVTGVAAGEATVTATVVADNGMTYTLDIPVTVS